MNRLPPEKGPSPYPLMPDIIITTSDITNLLRGLNIHKASGPDQISTNFLKETAEVVASTYSQTIASLNTGEVPVQDQRIANIVCLKITDQLQFHDHDI